MNKITMLESVRLLFPPLLVFREFAASLLFLRNGKLFSFFKFYNFLINAN